MNATISLSVVTIIYLGLFPYENNAVIQSDCTTSDEDIEYDAEERNFLVYLKKRSNNMYVSPLHDVPLNTNEDGVFRAVIVIPKLSTENNEFTYRVDLNPIIISISTNRTGMQWDYGALTQTWEDGRVNDPDTKLKVNIGQQDVLVFGGQSHGIGAVVKVKIVGAYRIGVYGSHRVIWQMIAIDAKDPKAATVNNTQDLDREFPGMLEEIEQWAMGLNLSWGQQNNLIKPVDAPMAVQMVKDKHDSWMAWQETGSFVMRVHPKANNTTLNNQWTLENFNIDEQGEP